MRYTENELRALFQSGFNAENWTRFLQSYLEGAQLRAVPEEFDVSAIDTRGYFLGDFVTEDHYRIGLFRFDVDAPTVSRRRVGLRNLVKSLINPKWGEFEATLAVFVSKTDWRLSFICDIKEEQTAPKRFTYVFGEKDLLYRTPVSRLCDIQGKVTFESLRKAFSVKELSDEFFNEYRGIYADFVQYITGNRYVKKTQGSGYELKSFPEEPRNIAFYEALGRDDKRARDFVKKMMGRITFLYFLQQKGWMCGDRNHMYNLYIGSEDKDYYLKRVLQPLFFGVLNTKPEDRKAVFKEKGWNDRLRVLWETVPYLNGGLFEPDEDDAAVDMCSQHIFREQDFNSLFNFFGQYNFTIDENDPSDAEIGVDPEMLGKIFESLLEDNKDKGAFYTPKEIVKYMCQESLIAYLVTKTGYDEKLIRYFVHSPEEGKVAFNEDQQYAILDAILKVKICDPAIGSGAFPIGLLNELVWCKEAIYGDMKGRAEIKREIIRDNIYGVDIEKGAVDIARLRFWLSLVVDEEGPSPLPNLDYKIMQGNSLLEWYNGVDLTELVSKNGQDLMLNNEHADKLKSKLSKLLKDYFGESDHAQKASLKIEISSTIIKLLSNAGIAIPNALDVAENNNFFLWHTWFSDVFSMGGFDIVIGNPPYLESRSPEFSDNLKTQLQGEILRKRPNDTKAFPRGADLLIYFYELALRLLNKQGYNVFITENSWLSTDYGKSFQDFLRKKCEVHAVIDSDYKYFETADINTVITFFRNKQEPSAVFPITFYHCNGSLKDYPCNTFSEDQTPEVSIKRYLSDEPVIISNKWSVVSGADEKVLSILEKLFTLQSKPLASQISIGQGLNISKSNIQRTNKGGLIPYFTSDDGAVYSWENAIGFVHPSVASYSRKKPSLILPRGIGTHFCCVNNLDGFTSSYVEIYGSLSEADRLSVWLFCNSSILWLLREITGRTNLGGGMLKAEATDFSSIPIAFRFNSEITRKIYSSLRGKSINSDILATLHSEEHQVIDNVVFTQLGLIEDQEYIVNSLIGKINGRKNKSRSK